MNDNQIKNNNEQAAAPSEEQAIEVLLRTAGIKEVNEATRQAARQTIMELQQHVDKPELMFQKAEQLGVPVEDFRNNQASLQAEQARIQKDIAVKEKRLEALVDEMDKGVHKSLIASTVAAIGGVVAAIFKAVKGKPNSKLKNAAILSGSAVIPGAVAWFLTSLFAVNPKKSEAIALSEELDAPRKEVEKLDEKIVAGTQKFHQDFIVALLKHNIQDYARQQQAETEEIKNAKPKDVEKQTKEITAKEKPGSPAKKIIDKISPVLSGGHKGKINEVREQQAAESQTQLSV